MNIFWIFLIIFYSDKNFTECASKSSSKKTSPNPSRKKQDIRDSKSRDVSPASSYNLPETLYEDPSHYYKEMLTLNPDATPFYPGSSSTNSKSHKHKDATTNDIGYRSSKEGTSGSLRDKTMKSPTPNTHILRDIPATRSPSISSHMEDKLNGKHHAGRSAIWNKNSPDIPSSSIPRLRESPHVGQSSNSNTRNTGVYIPSRGYPLTNNIIPSSNYILPNFSPFASKGSTTGNEPGAKIPIFSKEMREIAAKFRTPVNFKRCVNLPDFIVVSYSSLRPRIRRLAAIIYAIAIYDHNGNLINLFHPALPTDLDAKMYWNSEELNLVNSAHVRPLEEIKKTFSEKIKDKLILSYKLGRVLTLLGISVPNHVIRDLSHLERYILEHQGSLLQIVRYFLPSELPIPEGVESHLWDKKADYIRKVYLKLRQTWEDEVSFYFEIKKKYAYQPRILQQYYDNIYPGLQVDKEKDFSYWKESNKIPKHFFGIHIKSTYQKGVKYTVAVIFDAILNKVLETICGNDRMDDPLKAIDDNTFTGPRKAVERTFVNKILQLSNGSAPIIVGFDIYERLKIMDAEKRLVGSQIYDTKEIFEARTVCELAFKYTHIDYRLHFKLMKNSAENSESSISFAECDQKLEASDMAKISIKLFKLYCLNKHPNVRPLWMHI